jgi:K+-transporting ATPase A subunit
MRASLTVLYASALIVLVAASAYAAQLSVTAVSPLNPTPAVNTAVNGNTNENLQSYSLTVSLGQVSGVSVTVFCTSRVSSGPSLSVTLTLTSGSANSYGPVSAGSACNNNHVSTVTVPVSPSVSLSSIASVQVSYS